jgi:nucleoside-diphosphate-sugar epimerase
VKVLVTGGKGFLGKYVCEALARYDHFPIAAGREDGDLDRPSEALRLFQRVKPDAVIHLAATVGGIGANQRSPAVFWRENTSMGLNTLDAALAVGVKHFVMVGTTCSYPASPKTIPFIESELFDGYPEPTNAPYGIAKRSLIVGAMAYRKQFGMDVSVAIPTNLYGPGDNFSPETSHVIPALVKKMVAAILAKAKVVDIWGSGRPTRDFLYVKDAADGIARMVASKVDGQIINFGSGTEVSIEKLVERVATATGYTGAFKFDSSKPDGQLRRVLGIRKSKELLDWSPTTPLRHGLLDTVRYYSEVKP